MSGTLTAGIAGGAVVFAMYFLYDINSVLWKKKLPKTFFLLGTALLAALTLWQAWEARAQVRFGFRFWVCLFLAALALVLLMDALFFSLPFEETYLSREDGLPRVYDGGMYALCRHPGVLWFFLFYLFFGLALWPSQLLAAGLFYSACNVLYVIVQDAWTFPHTFSDYGAYRKQTPFLIPRAESIRRAWETRRHFRG